MPNTVGEGRRPGARRADLSPLCRSALRHALNGRVGARKPAVQSSSVSSSADMVIWSASMVILTSSQSLSSHSVVSR